MKLNKYNINQYIRGNSLYCNSIGITSIEDIPDNITEIYCSNNKLTSYPVNLEDKQWMIQHNNQIKLINRSTIINSFI